MESSSEQMWILLSEFILNFAQIRPDNYLTEKRERKNKSNNKNEIKIKLKNKNKNKNTNKTKHLPNVKRGNRDP